MKKRMKKVIIGIIIVTLFLLGMYFLYESTHKDQILIAGQLLSLYK